MIRRIHPVQTSLIITLLMATILIEKNGNAYQCMTIYSSEKDGQNHDVRQIITKTIDHILHSKFDLEKIIPEDPEKIKEYLLYQIVQSPNLLQNQLRKMTEEGGRIYISNREPEETQWGRYAGFRDGRIILYQKSFSGRDFNPKEFEAAFYRVLALAFRYDEELANKKPGLTIFRPLNPGIRKEPIHLAERILGHQASDLNSQSFQDAKGFLHYPAAESDTGLLPIVHRLFPGVRQAVFSDIEYTESQKVQPIEAHGIRVRRVVLNALSESPQQESNLLIWNRPGTFGMLMLDSQFIANTLVNLSQNGYVLNTETDRILLRHFSLSDIGLKMVGQLEKVEGEHLHYDAFIYQKVRKVPKEEVAQIHDLDQAIERFVDAFERGNFSGSVYHLSKEGITFALGRAMDEYDNVPNSGAEMDHSLREFVSKLQSLPIEVSQLPIRRLLESTASKPMQESKASIVYVRNWLKNNPKLNQLAKAPNRDEQIFTFSAQGKKSPTGRLKFILEFDPST